MCGVHGTTAAIVLLQNYHVVLPDSTTVESNTVAPPAVPMGQHRRGLLLGQAADANPVQARIPPGPTPGAPGPPVPPGPLELAPGPPGAAAGGPAGMLLDLLDLLLDLDF